ncbi:MAG: glycosyltransferase family 4 protein [Spongiibacteraceae bacterium]|nr:glycosyltransferase family 4 protein [Spongiibacteraceae bacterium]
MTTEIAPVRVTQVASGDLWAGAEKQLLVLAKALRRQGVEVSAVILNPGPLADRLQAEGFTLQVLDENRQGSIEIFRELRTFLRTMRPDVVHTHRVKENILAGLAAASLGIRSIRTQHGAQEHPASLFDVRRQVMRTADWLTGTLLQRHIVAVSEVLEEQLASRFGRSKVVRIENGLDIDDAPLQRDWSPRSRWHIGIVGRQVPVKRVDLFLQAARQLEQRLPHQAFQFSVIGDGPLLAAHQAQAANLCFRNPVEFTGHIDNAEAAIAGLDLLVICSDHEGLPMVALEAMRAGTVVVTHAIGALPTLLDENRGGLFAPGHSVEAFADTMAAALTDPEQLAARARYAYQRLRDDFSADSMARRYLEAYR